MQDSVEFVTNIANGNPAQTALHKCVVVFLPYTPLDMETLPDKKAGLSAL